MFFDYEKSKLIWKFYDKVGRKIIGFGISLFYKFGWMIDWLWFYRYIKKGLMWGYIYYINNV